MKDRQATVEELAEFLVKSTGEVYYFGLASRTLHARVSHDGAVYYWLNWEGDETEDYASLTDLLNEKNWLELPMLSEFNEYGKEWYHIDPPEKYTPEQKEFVKKLEEFKTLALKVVDLWDNDLIENYPKELDSFDEEVSVLMEIRTKSLDN